jgi:hypothetical protein
LIKLNFRSLLPIVAVTDSSGLKAFRGRATLGQVANGVQVLVALVFGTSVLAKVRSRPAFVAFAGSVAEILPGRPGRAVPTAVAVVAAEAAVPGLLLVPAAAAGGYLVAMALLAMFGVAIVRAARGASGVTCACFGPRGDRLGIRHLVRNALLFAAATTGLLAGRPASPGALVDAPGSAAVELIAAAVVTAFVVRFDDLVDLMFPAPVDDAGVSAWKRT